MKNVYSAVTGAIRNKYEIQVQNSPEQLKACTRFNLALPPLDILSASAMALSGLRPQNAKDENHRVGVASS